jgi:hypothetical protein
MVFRRRVLSRAAFNCIIEGRECARAQARAVVLGANCLGLGPVSEPNPRQFGNLTLTQSRGRPNHC